MKEFYTTQARTAKIKNRLQKELHGSLFLKIS